MDMEQLHYCKRCGRLVRKDTNMEKKCDFCKYEVQLVPDEYRGFSRIKKELEQEFMDQYIKSSPEFDPELHKQMKEYVIARRNDRPSKQVGNPYGIECPYCHSTYIERISGMTVSVFTDASAVGKQFKCQHCSAYF